MEFCVREGFQTYHPNFSPSLRTSSVLTPANMAVFFLPSVRSVHVLQGQNPTARITIASRPYGTCNAVAPTLIGERQRLPASEQHGKASQHSCKIHKAARKDQKRWLEQACGERASGTAQAQWAPLKFVHKGYRPRPIN